MESSFLGAKARQFAKSKWSFNVITSFFYIRAFEDNLEFCRLLWQIFSQYPLHRRLMRNTRGIKMLKGRRTRVYKEPFARSISPHHLQLILICFYLQYLTSFTNSIFQSTLSSPCSSKLPLLPSWLHFPGVWKQRFSPTSKKCHLGANPKWLYSVVVADTHTALYCVDITAAQNFQTGESQTEVEEINYHFLTK